ncbi:hypothetical protein EDD86DRAFT_248276 [Gorgonomyces haynaldii]|nr:hypothetical protein EDD86DRAFT_248276 [Gorgonomyces haynaldii]
MKKYTLIGLLELDETEYQCQYREQLLELRKKHKLDLHLETLFESRVTPTKTNLFKYLLREELVQRVDKRQQLLKETKITSNLRNDLDQHMDEDQSKIVKQRKEMKQVSAGTWTTTIMVWCSLLVLVFAVAWALLFMRLVHASPKSVTVTAVSPSVTLSNAPAVTSAVMTSVVSSASQCYNGTRRTLMLQPRQYQLKIYEIAKQMNTLCFLGTGLGKTLVAILLMQQFHKKWFLCPTMALVQQQADRIQRQTDFKVEIVTETQMPLEWNVIVSTPQILLQLLRHSFFKLQDLDLLVIDECHHCQGDSPMAVLMRDFYHPSQKKPRIFAMTASPLLQGVSQVQQARNAVSRLEKLLDCTIFHIHMKQVCQEYLVQYPFNNYTPQWIASFKNVADEQVYKQALDISHHLGESSLVQFCQQHGFNQEPSERHAPIVDTLLRYICPRTIVFVEKRIIAKQLTHLLTQLTALKVMFMVGQRSEQQDHLKIMQLFESGVIQVLVVTRVGEEGIDIPDCSTVILFNLFRSASGYVQARGRARVKGSRYIILVEQGNQKHIQTLASARATEQILIQMTQSCLKGKIIETDSDELTDYLMGKLDPPLESKKGAKITAASALHVVHWFYSKSNRSTEHKPVYQASTDYKTFLKEYPKQCKMLNIPCDNRMLQDLKHYERYQLNVQGYTVYGPPRASFRLARNACALQACRYLYLKKLLDEQLLPHLTTNETNTRVVIRRQPLQTGDCLTPIYLNGFTIGILTNTVIPRYKHHDLVQTDHSFHVAVDPQIVDRFQDFIREWIPKLPCQLVLIDRTGDKPKVDHLSMQEVCNQPWQPYSLNPKIYNPLEGRSSNQWIVRTRHNNLMYKTLSQSSLTTLDTFQLDHGPLKGQSVSYKHYFESLGYQIHSNDLLDVMRLGKADDPFNPKTAIGRTAHLPTDAVEILSLSQKLYLALVQMPYIVDALIDFMNSKTLNLKYAQQALTVPPLQDNYERLEILGDGFLKASVSLDLFLKFGSEQEMSQKRSKIISNSHLLQLGLERKIDTLLKTQGQLTSSVQVSDKTIADAVEAIFGAHLIEHGFYKSFNYLKQWQLVSADYTPMQPSTTDSLSEWIEEKLRVRCSPDLLKTAFTHASMGFNNYQRLEFLGDALLEWIVTQYYYTTLPNATPMAITDLKQVVCSSEGLCTLCVELGLDQWIRYQDVVIEHDIASFKQYLLTKPKLGHYTLEGPKILGDVVESVLAVLFLHSQPDEFMDRTSAWMIPYLQSVDPETVEKNAVRQLVSTATQMFDFCQWDGDLSSE